MAAAEVGDDVYGEDPTVRMLVGGLMVLAAMLIVEITPRRSIEAEVTHIAV